MWKQRSGLQHRSDIVRLTLCLLVQQNRKPLSKITSVTVVVIIFPSPCFLLQALCTHIKGCVIWRLCTNGSLECKLLQWCYQRIGDAYKINLKVFLVLQKIIHFLNSFKSCYFLHNFSACGAYFVMVCITDLFRGEWKCLIRHYLIYITFRGRRIGDGSSQL